MLNIQFPANSITKEIENAFEHVRSFHPECVACAFDADQGYYSYLSADGMTFVFSPKVDPDFCNEALNSVKVNFAFYSL